MPPRNNRPKMDPTTSNHTHNNLTANNITRQQVDTGCNQDEWDASFPFLQDNNNNMNSCTLERSAYMTPTNNNSNHNNNNIILDPKEVLEASLVFEQSCSSQHRQQSPLIPQPMDFRVTSSTSLYPSVESLGDANDDLDLAKHWEAAAVSSSQKKKAKKNPTTSTTTSTSQQLELQLSSPIGTMKRLESSTSSTIRSPTTTSSSSPYFGEQPYASIFTARQGNDHECKMEVTNDVVLPFAARNPKTTCISSAISPTAFASTRACLPTSRSTEDGDDDDFIEAKLAAYSGCSSNSFRTAPVTSSRARSNSNNSNFQDNNDDNDLISMKRAAYHGRPISAPRSTSRRSRHQDDDDDDQQQQAEATVIGYDFHPSHTNDNLNNAVQAEFVGQNFCDTTTVSNVYDSTTASTIAGGPITRTLVFSSSLTSSPSQVYCCQQQVGADNATELADDTTAGEAAVIENSPMEKATAEAWSNAPAAEAFVMQQRESSSSSTSSSSNLDSKPPAVNYSQQSSEVLADQQAEATVLDYYDVHPSEILTDAVQAEYVGQDFHASIDMYHSERHNNNTNTNILAATSAMMTPVSCIHHNSASHIIEVSGGNESSSASLISDQVTEATVIESEFPNNNSISAMAMATETTDSLHPFAISGNQDDDLLSEHVTEATVIESGPMEKATALAWSAESEVEEAQVLEDTTTAGMVPPDVLDAKPPPPEMENTQTWEQSVAGGVQFGGMISDGEAEVVGITEEVHPSEMTNEHAAQAELIGSDFNCAIAVPSTNQEHSGINADGDVVEEAEIVAEEEPRATYTTGSSPAVHETPIPQQPQEAHATIINEEHFSSLERGPHHLAQHASPVTAISPMTGPQPATPVTVLEQTSNEQESGVCFNTPGKPDPLASRAATDSFLSTDHQRPNYGVRNWSSDHSTIDEVDMQEWTRVPSFGGTNGEPPPAMPPPIVEATRVADLDLFSNGSAPPIPIRCPPGSTASNESRSRSCGSGGSGTQCGFNVNQLSSNIARGTNNVMEMLFGNSGKPSGRRGAQLGLDLDSSMGSVLPRTLLPASVIYSESTNSWVGTVNTNQKALEANNVEESSKALRAFSVPTKKQAVALARAWAPPKMHPFESNPCCFICEAHFAVFRRASHCRNCGVCVCNSCSVQWPSKMLPATYNHKRVSMMNICKACDWLCSAFRLALLHGNHDKAVALYATGNVNLTTPFANVKGELFYPVHCAVIGGNLQLLKWLVDEHCCPLRSIRISSGKQKNAAGSYTPILTSKGRSLLGIALENRNIGIVRYLVVEKRMLLAAEKGLSVETLVQNLDLVLRVLPESVLGEQSLGLDQTDRLSSSGGENNSTRTPTVAMTDQDSDVVSARSDVEDEALTGPVHDECIICCDNDIDCVMTPCGHQLCCMTCGSHITRCPVCSSECTPIRVFKS